jgi:AraC-like DNA-binding protein
VLINMYGKVESKNIFSNSLSNIQIFPNEHDGKVGPHSHDFYEFVLVEKGFSLHICQGSTTIVTSGDLFVIRPKEIHSYISAHHTKIYNILFMPSAIADIYDQLSKLPGLDKILNLETKSFECLKLDHTEKQKFLSLIMGITAEYQKPDTGSELQIKAMLILFLTAYSRCYIEHNSKRRQNEQKKTNFSPIYRVLELIEENPYTELTVDQMSKAAGLSHDYMSKIFKNLTGMTPAKFSRNFRITKATELLCSTDMNISEVAATLGFCDISVFSRQFKQVSGISPSEFRRNYNKNIDIMKEVD